MSFNFGSNMYWALSLNWLWIEFYHYTRLSLFLIPDMLPRHPDRPQPTALLLSQTVLPFVHAILQSESHSWFLCCCSHHRTRSPHMQCQLTRDRPAFSLDHTAYRSSGFFSGHLEGLHNRTQKGQGGNVSWADYEHVKWVPRAIQKCWRCTTWLRKQMCWLGSCGQLANSSHYICSSLPFFPIFDPFFLGLHPFYKALSCKFWLREVAF